MVHAQEGWHLELEKLEDDLTYKGRCSGGDESGLRIMLNLSAIHLEQAWSTTR